MKVLYCNCTVTVTVAETETGPVCTGVVGAAVLTPTKTGVTDDDCCAEITEPVVRPNPEAIAPALAKPSLEAAVNACCKEGAGFCKPRVRLPTPVAPAWFAASMMLPIRVKSVMVTWKEFVAEYPTMVDDCAPVPYCGYTE